MERTHNGNNLHIMVGCWRKIVGAGFLLLAVEIKVCSTFFFIGEPGPGFPGMPAMPAMPTMAPYCSNAPYGNCKHGSCSWTDYGRCICYSGWTGQWCDHEQQLTGNACGDHACVHGSCHSTSTQWGWDHYCACESGWSGTSCDTAVSTSFQTVPTAAPTTTTATTKPPPQTTTTTQTTTATTTIHVPTKKTPVPIVDTLTTMSVKSNCSKESVVLSLALHTPVSNLYVEPCPSGDHTTAEAFVLNNCNLTLPSTWTPGVKVSTHCVGIPQYTPIAVFNTNGQHPSGAPAGVLIGCLQNGFKIAQQTCYGTGPSIMHVQFGDLNNIDPDSYFTLN